MALSSIQGKTAIVTGAGAGINLCFAKLLLSKGCNVVFADLQLRPESKEVIDAHQSGSPRAVFQETNVTQWMDLERMFKTCEQHFGSADIVCPGAGVFEPVSLHCIVSYGYLADVSSPSRISGFHLALENPKTRPMETAMPVSKLTSRIQFARLNSQSHTSSSTTNQEASYTSLASLLRAPVL